MCRLPASWMAASAQHRYVLLCAALGRRGRALVERWQLDGPCRSPASRLRLRLAPTRLRLDPARPRPRLTPGGMAALARRGRPSPLTAIRPHRRRALLYAAPLRALRHHVRRRHACPHLRAPIGPLLPVAHPRPAHRAAGRRLPQPRPHGLLQPLRGAWWAVRARCELELVSPRPGHLVDPQLRIDRVVAGAPPGRHGALTLSSSHSRHSAR